MNFLPGGQVIRRQGGMMKNIRIRILIQAISLVVVFGFGMVGLIYFFGNSSQANFRSVSASEMRGALISKDIKMGFLSARRREKEFLLRPTEKFMKDHQDAVAAVLPLFEELKTVYQQPERQTQIDAMKKEFVTYGEKFTRVAEMYARLGMTENDGLQGELRTAVQAVEKRLESLREENLLLLLLQMRAHEKDFLLTLDANHADLLIKGEEEFISMLDASGISGEAKSDISKQMGAYINAFKEFANLKNQLTNHISVLSGLYVRAEPKLDKIVEAGLADAAAAQTALEDNISTTNITSMASMLILGALSLAVALVVGAGISKPIQSLSLAMRRLAEGDNSVPIPGQDYGNEIGEMASTVQVFKNNAIEKQQMEAEQRAQNLRAEEDKRRAIADFASEIGQMAGQAKDGNLSARIDLNAKEGELLAVSQHLNDLVATIEAGIRETVEVMTSMAKGDLTHKMAGDYRGAFLDLKNASNATIDKLSEVVSNIRLSATEVHHSSQEIAEGNNDLANRTEQQAHNLEKTSSAMEELVATVRQNAENSSGANKLSTSAQTTAERGGSVVTEAVSAMERIDTSSHKISDIMDLIDEIAFQTNLLALNAAVEAARAGDAGKGFAVVAQEVRALAQRSSAASKEIKSLIDISAEQVTQGVDLVNRTGSTLTEIVAAIRKVNQIVGEISNASTEQTIGLEDINRSVSAIEEVTQQNAALVEEITAAAQSLANQSSNLSQMVSFFSVGPTGGASASIQVKVPHAAPAKGGVRKAAPPPPPPSAASNADDSDWEEF